MNSNITPNDIVLNQRDKRIVVAEWSVVAQNIAWAIVRACQLKGDWEPLSLQEISKHLQVSGQILVHMIDGFFQPKEFLELISCRYEPTDKFIKACQTAHST